MFIIKAIINSEGNERSLPTSLFNMVLYLGLIVVLLYNTTMKNN